MLWVLKRDGSFDNLKHMLNIMGKKIFTIYSEMFCLSKPMNLAYMG